MRSLNVNRCPIGGTPTRRPRSCAKGEFPVQRLRLDRPGCRWQGTRPKVRGPEDIAQLVDGLLADRPQESLVVLLLDSAHHVVSAAEIALGSIASVEVDARLLLGVALSAGVPRIAIAHNHPSGLAIPSSEDDELTRRLGEACRIVGLTLVDHLIVGAGGAWYSCSGEGRLPRSRR